LEVRRDFPILRRLIVQDDVQKLTWSFRADALSPALSVSSLASTVILPATSLRRKFPWSE
jgi:hypothetical protein